MIRISLIDHIVLRTELVESMVRFYSKILGCKIERATSPEIGLTQLRAGKSLIDIVAVDSELGRAGGGPPTPGDNNMDHFCLQIETIDEDDLRNWLNSHGIDHGEFEIRYGSEGFGPSIYINDPDGNTVELRCEPAPTQRRSRFQNARSG